MSSTRDTITTFIELLLVGGCINLLTPRETAPRGRFIWLAGEPPHRRRASLTEIGAARWSLRQDGRAWFYIDNGFFGDN